MITRVGGFSPVFSLDRQNLIAKWQASKLVPLFYVLQFPNFVGMIISGMQLSLFLFFPTQQGKVLPTVSIS